MDISLTWERRSEMIHEALWFLSTGFLEGQGNTSRLLLMFSGYQNKYLSPWSSRWVHQKKFMDSISREYGGVPLKLPFAPF
jgi:hypothetical protein